eukprot:10447895-Lingulodinium_polyedra.AAC.1
MCRRAAAGPPLKTTSHRRLLTCTCACPASWASAAGSGTSPGAGGPPTRIHLYKRPAPFARA